MACTIRFLALILLLVVQNALADLENSSPLEDPNAVALALSMPIAACMQKHDTNHPIFHGCIDWHSTVHAAWSLSVYTRVTGDNRYREFLKDYIAPDKIDLERQELEDFPNFEMPYGRAWFLLLATEYDRTIDDRLVEMGDEVAESIVKRYKERPPVPFTRTYDNSAWALVNLLRYARYRGRDDWQAFVELQVRNEFLEGECRVDDEGPGFMAVCLNWAWLVSEVLDREEFMSWWSQDRAEVIETLQPILEPRTSHEFGMNFSRAWGLWALYSKTGDERYRELYAEHVEFAYTNEDHWNGDYQRVSHWVAQFGMHAVMMPELSMDELSPR